LLDDELGLIATRGSKPAISILSCSLRCKDTYAAFKRIRFHGGRRHTVTVGKQTSKTVRKDLLGHPVERPFFFFFDNFDNRNTHQTTCFP
jgi:hypothetical protein